MKFSIILPTYNRADTYLKDAIDSVVNQSYINWELLIIDNHSTDNTDELIGSYKDDRIKLYKIRNNGNIAKSRNLGLKKSKGEYIAFLDSDDIWKKDKLKIQLKFMKKKKANFSFSSYKIINEQDAIIGHRKAQEVLTYEKLIYSCDLGLSTVVLKKSI